MKIINWKVFKEIEHENLSKEELIRVIEDYQEQVEWLNETIRMKDEELKEAEINRLRPRDKWFYPWINPNDNWNDHLLFNWPTSNIRSSI